LSRKPPRNTSGACITRAEKVAASSGYPRLRGALATSGYLGVVGFA
jgi:hypothetical protein